jgi:FixJ family two-component response regulator
VRRVTTATVHVVDDDAAIRTAIARLLRADGLNVVTHATAAELLTALQRHEPGCIVLDLQLGTESGLDVQAELSLRDDALPILFLTAYGTIPDSVRALQHGAVDFLMKPINGDALVAAVHRALQVDAATSERRRQRVALRERFARLTAREREVFLHLIGGRLNKQIAFYMNLAERTVKLHRANIFAKLDTRSIPALVRLARDLDIEPIDTSEPCRKLGMSTD